MPTERRTVRESKRKTEYGRLVARPILQTENAQQTYL